MAKAEQPEEKNYLRFPLPDIYDNDDPHLIYAAIDTIEYLLRTYIPELGFNGQQLEYAIEVARDIRFAWLIDYELDIPEIPLANNLQWPEKQDFVKIEQWFTTVAGCVDKHIREVDGQLMNFKQEANNKPEETEQGNEPASHSPDYRSVHWYGTDYRFTAMQSDVVEILWEAWENGTPEVGQNYILEEIGSDSDRLRDIFKGNSAWETLIVSGGTSGSFKLNEPKK